jgi:hypothetical protein
LFLFQFKVDKYNNYAFYFYLQNFYIFVDNVSLSYIKINNFMRRRTLNHWSEAYYKLRLCVRCVANVAEILEKEIL